MATKQDQDDIVAVDLGLERMDVKSSCAAQVESYNQCVTVYLELEWNDAELSCVAQVESGASARLSVEHAMAAASQIERTGWTVDLRVSRLQRALQCDVRHDKDTRGTPASVVAGFMAMATLPDTKLPLHVFEARK